MVTREQVLSFRRSVQALDQRLPPGPDSLRRAAWAGLQDSVPRSALHSLHARVEGTPADVLEDPSLVQVWGPRYTAYVVPAGDYAAFTLGRLPEEGRTRQRAQDLAARLHKHLAGRSIACGEAGRALGTNPNNLRYAALTGTVLIRWHGARQPTVETVPAPAIDPIEARLELVRRYLHVYGPSTTDGFARWSGVERRAAIAAFDALGSSLLAVRTPLGDAWILAADEPTVRERAAPAARVRLLPSGDPYYLLWGADRELLVPNPARRSDLWTSRVWPGAILIGGEIAGTWRRAEAVVVATPWRRLSGRERDAVAREAADLPLPEVSAAPVVRWDGG